MLNAEHGPSTERGTISTGVLPESGEVRALVDRAYELHRSNTEGEVSRVYPALERVPPDLFGICLIGKSGQIYEVGDTGTAFTIMSVSKPFVFALVCQAIGAESVRQRIGVNATGLPFNSVAAIEQGVQGRTNPMVNAGAIATTSLVPGQSRDERREWIRQGLSRFAGRSLELNDEVYQSAIATNQRNRSLANLLVSMGRIDEAAEDAVDLYTWQCALDVTARDLAVMGATLAFGGINPLSGEQVVDREVCHHTLAVMITAGMYETSGDWLYDVGLPGKSGIGGGIVTVSPGKGGMGTFAPRLDAAGNSVKGQLVARYLSRQLGLDLLAS